MANHKPSLAASSALTPPAPLNLFAPPPPKPPPNLRFCPMIGLPIDGAAGLFVCYTGAGLAGDGGFYFGCSSSSGSL